MCCGWNIMEPQSTANTVSCLFTDTSYLLFANHFFIFRVNLDGTNPLVLLTQFSGGAAGIEFDLVYVKT